MTKISEIMILQQPAQPALTVEVRTDIHGMSKAIGEYFMKIGKYIEAHGKMPTDIPFVAYPDFERMDEQNIRMIIGFKLAEALPGSGDIRSVQLPAAKTVFCLHRGTYTELADLYNEMSNFIKSKGYRSSGMSVEYYYTGPDFPENEHVTRVEMPLK